MAARTHGAARARERAHAPARRAAPAAARIALGPRREAVLLPRPARRGVAVRSLPRPEPAARLPLHVRTRLGRGLPELLPGVRPRRRRTRAPGAPRRELHGGVTRPPGEARSLQAAHGLALPVGLVLRKRLQPRLCRLVHPAGSRAGRRRLQLPRGERSGRGPARHQRVLQGRRRRRLPHLLDLRPGRRTDDRRLLLARLRAQGTRRRRARVHDELAAPPRSLRTRLCRRRGSWIRAAGWREGPCREVTSSTWRYTRASDPQPCVPDQDGTLGPK